MKYIFLVLLALSYFTSLAHGTCVFESEFGFILNCNFKKSGLFRVRNLGGLKAHFGLGFSLGDELGFAESLGNVEGDRRRALNYRTGAVPNNIGVLPAEKQSSNLSPQSIQNNRPIAVTPRPKSVMMMNRLKTNAPTYNKRSNMPLMTQAASLPLGVPAFKPIPPKEEKPPIMTILTQSENVNNFNKKVMIPTPFQSVSRNNITFIQPMKPSTLNYVVGSSQQPASQIPPFHAMPTSVSRISTGEIHEVDNAYEYQANLPQVNLMGHTVEELAAAANVSVEAIKQAIFMRQQQLLAEQRAAIIRDQMLFKTATTTQKPITTTRLTTTTTTTTTVMPTKEPIMIPPPTVSGHKVMNAPKEYYPVGYEKNFDDNFTSKVDLPPTSFHCGDQKHFPGLYSDMDLGCMVFHVCALTDDGLIMKSFLCPESTLFDQTILKCNWWFYVDCKSSKDLYDSNIPISKSYQLMKSLTYFSNYKNSNSNARDTGVNIESLKNTVSGTNPT